MFRIIRLHGPQAAREWPLVGNGPFLIGRPHADLGRPDVDLSPDRAVSRQHAKIWFDHGQWWIRDLRSATGTRVAGRTVPRAESSLVAAGDDIDIGGTRLTLLPANRHRVEHGSLSIDFTLATVAGAALAHAGAPLISDVEVRNAGGAARGGDLGMTLPGVGRGSASIASLEPGQRRCLGALRVKFDEISLRQRRETGWQAAFVEIDGTAVEVAGAGVWVLARDEWSRCAEHRRGLAAFVLPGHPRVVQLASAAIAGEPSPPPPPELLRAVYEQLHTVWSIGYRFEVPANAAICQKLRLPDQVLRDVAARTGEGTCLDLALLIAGCLESLHAQPLLAVIDAGGEWHALVGCRRVNGSALEVVLADRQQLPGAVDWVDPNGCTRDPTQRLDFAAACARGEQLMHRAPLIFALDVAAARRDGLPPMPVLVDLTLSAPVARALAGAEAAAHRAGSQVSTVALLVGLLGIEGGLLRAAIAELIPGADAVEQLAAALPRSDSAGGPSRNFGDVITLAQQRAREENAATVLERHVIAALLGARSRALEDALRWLGADRGELDAMLGQLDGEYRRSQSDHSVFESSVVPRRR